jgi:aerobic carbon-monoxide dehydrogenase medium subunit
MQAFNYHRANSAAEAATLFGNCEDARFLAGGQSLLPSMRMRLATPADVIDLAGASALATISEEAGVVVIGAMCRHAEVETSELVKARIPALAQLAGGIGDRQVRNLGTAGGSLANNDPSACYPAAALGLGATIVTNQRAIAADAYFKGLFETALEPGEVITSIRFPIVQRAAYIKFKQSASRFALVGVFVSQGSAGVRVAVTGAGQGGVFRATALEAALTQSWTPAAAKAVSISADDMLSDIHADAEYRAHLISILAARAVAAA